MRIDLHTHSLASDGTDTPAGLVRAAVAAGLDVVALTDHDTAAGWAEAEAEAGQHPIRLVRGMEISTVLDGRGAHLLAYHLDPTHPGLVAALTRVLEGRTRRVPAMVEKLQALGIGIEVADVERVAGASSAAGRPHVADALVALGVVPHRNDAFAQYLSPGRPGHVRRGAADLREMVPLVVAAGGVPVLAHAWGRHGEVVDEAGFAELAALGLAGLEADHQDHTPDQRQRLRAIAENLGLVVTGSSDYHGTGKTDHDLGVHTTAPEELARIDELAGL